ncbi:MAG TPA: CAP domain-containing protein [Solimonas sp.]|nr:CAP domain-containing protein [Solimonas sp.]
MKRFAAAIGLVACLAASAQPPAQAPAPVPDFEPADFAGMVNAHNSLRGRVGVPGLAWSNPLAAQAQGWANQLAAEGCRALRYDPDPVRRDTVGQNIMNSWTSKPYAGFRKAPTGIVDRWAEDGRFYDLRSNSCAAPPGRQCGQYTQLVWEQTRALGCGRARCDNAEVWVCNYTPRGNLPGRRPYGEQGGPVAPGLGGTASPLLPAPSAGPGQVTTVPDYVPPAPVPVR